MTATLNDCTVTTNGDTLHEQILLTCTKENVKQRTTPSNYDVFAWGHDDANNGSGNFSSYSVTDSVGDIPNGAYPTVWYSDASGTSTLMSASSIVAPNAQASPTANVTAGSAYPFLSSGLYSFNIGGTAAAGGIGFYIAKPANSAVTGANLLNGGTVVVPFVDCQPVWTTGFPGGDLLSIGNIAVTGGSSGAISPGFTIVSADGTAGTVKGETLVLLKTVPPYCMIGARLYINATDGQQAVGTAVVANGFVAGLVSGGLGQAGSVYSFVTSRTGGLAAIATTLALQAGFQVTTTSMPVFGATNVTEPLVISPLIWADSAEFQTVGLYGMTNMQVVMNFTGKLGTAQAILTGISSGTAALAGESYWSEDLSQLTTNTGNILRSSGLRTTISDLAFSNVANSLNGPWTTPTLFVTFLTPGPDVTLPLVSTVPYIEMPRYVLQQSVGTGQIGATQLSTNTISLTSIPDMIMLYVKPATKGPGQLDTYIPIKNVSISFDNFSNLCSGFQQFNLYESSVAAGLDIDFAQFRGFTAGAANSYSRVTGQNAFISDGSVRFKSQPVTQLSGGPLLLRMGHDVTLSPGLAPGCLGNYSIQANITVDNQFGFFDYVNTCTVTLIAINTGFFETVRGQSAIRKTVLNSADVEAATPEAGVSRTQLTRMVGRGAYGHALSHFATHALSQAGSAAKDYMNREGYGHMANAGHNLVDMGVDHLKRKMNGQGYGGGSGLR